MIFLLVIAVIAGVLVGPMLVSETATAPPGDNQAVVSTADQIGLPTLSIRVAAWKSALAIIIDSPDVPFSGDNYHWLRRAIGYGPEALIAVSQTRFPDVLKSQYTFESLVISQPENHYLYLGTTVGILGLLVFLSILAAFFYKGFRLLMKTGDRETILLSAAFIAAILQYCVHILFNASVIDPELVFWLVMASTVALVRLEEEKAVGTESAGAPGGDESGAVKSAGNLRNAVAVLALLGFASLGLYLTVPPLLANMKIQSGLSLLRSDKQAALTMYQDATKIEPRQSYYFNFVGNLAYIMAKGESDPGEKTKFLSISEGAYLKAIEREPEMAIWRYRLADIDVFWSENGDRSKMDQALSLYKEADTIFPGNAVILNKWAFALILKGDHDAARAKLEESQKSDPNWIQTAFFKGYIEASRGNLGEAANLFLTPQQNKLNDVRFVTNFCSILAQYKGVQPVSGALESKVNAGASDWVGYAFLGIAEAYNGDFEGAVRAFSNAAGLVPQESKPLLGGTIQAVFIGSGPYEKTGQEIIQKLMGSQPGIR
jgi:tetratricopeptide (TPR) repeat protein